MTPSIKDNQVVVIKKVSSDYTSDSVVSNLKNEFSILSYLNSEKLLKVYGFETIRNDHFLILEDTNGIPLRHLIKNKQINIENFLVIAQNIVVILNEIHEKKVVHKDIKPDNIIVDTDTWDVQIIDFGISSRLSKEETLFTNPNTLEGTLQYISPEQTGRINQIVDNRSDFYSLGITFYQMLTGKLPFDSDDPLELVHAHLAINPTPPAVLNPEIPETISNIILKLVSKRPEGRYQTALGLKNDLERCRNEFNTTGILSVFPLGTRDIKDEFSINRELYGRKSELALILDNFKKTCETGSTSLTLISGHPGVGKSALMKATNESVIQSKGYFLTGKFDSHSKNIPLSAIIQAFTRLIRFILTETQEQIENWKIILQKAVGTNGKVITDVLPDLELIIGKQPDVAELDSQENANRFYLVFINFIKVFANEEHPLLIFLDDWQWADSTSLELIKNLLGDDTATYIFLVLAYRDNELDKNRLFFTAIEDIKKQVKNIYSIELKPITQEDINHLLSDSLASDKNRSKKLSEIVFGKTGGNPFFVIELLKQLVKSKFIYFDHTAGLWDWNLSEVGKTTISENVIELLIEKIKKLPNKIQKILQIASCIGNEFDLYILSQISKLQPYELAEILVETVNEDLIVPRSDVYKTLDKLKSQVKNLAKYYRTAKKTVYKFQHDRVFQASYGLLDEKEKKELRLEIGRVLLKSIKSKYLENKIFEVVNHLNTGIEFISDQLEKEKLCELNLIAGKKAKSSTAYSYALEILKNSVRLLDANSWKDKYKFTLDIYMEYAELEYLNRNYEKSEKLIYLILENASSSVDKALAYRLLIIGYTMQAMYPEAISSLIKALKPLGIDLPEKDYEVVLGEELGLITKNLGDRSISSLIDSPEMNDREKVIATQLLTSSLPTAYFLNPNLWCVMMAKTVNLCLEYGNLPESYGYACFGIFQGVAFGEYKKGYDYCDLALKISEKFGSKSNICKAANVFANHSASWVQHIKYAEEVNRMGLQVGIEVGEIQHASYCALQISVNSFIAGKQLNTVLEESLELLRYSKKVNNTASINFIIGVVINSIALTGERKEIEEEIENLTPKDYVDKCIANKDLLSLSTYRILSSQYWYILGDYEQGLEESLEAEKLLSYISGMAAVSEHNFYNSLLLLSKIEKSQEEERQKLLDKVISNQKQMKIWSENCSENFLHKYYLVEAEIAKIEGRNWDASLLYKKASNEANKNGFIQVQAIVNERNGLFWLSHNEPEIAKLYFTSAFFDFREWGAIEKTKKMKEAYPDFIKERRRDRDSSDILNTTSSTYINSQSIDLQSVLKGATAISSEIQIDRLIDRMIRIVVENAGAQRGIFILVEDDKLFIEAEGKVGQETELKNSISLENFVDIPTSIVLYTARTKQYLVIGNAAQDERFKNDNYIITSKTMSILCVPLIHKDKLIGIIYLENNLSEGAFTPDRLSVIKTLSSQIAISLENAKLYASIEDVTREKTKISTEMEIARQIQTSLLPKNLEVDGFQITAYMKTADEVGGDYYDLIHDGERTWFIIGDVSGHGVTAGLIMMMVQTAIHSVISTNSQLSTEEILYKVNDVIGLLIFLFFIK